MLSPVEQIKEKLNIADVVSSYVKLEKAGANFRARCPFHSEKTPSFFVSPVRGSYHCFGCSRGGDIFTFVEEIEGIDFSGALKILAERAGVSLRDTNSGERHERAVLYAILGEAASFYENVMAERPDIKKYLADRGLYEKTRAEFHVGYAPDGWSSLIEYLHSKHFRDADIEKTGLIIAGTKGFYDRFRGRIMFPIADSQGRIVAFSGRIYPVPAEAGANPPAKYVNSPETSLYSKSNILFGYDKAKRAMMTKNRAILVEGQMDLIMAHQAGTVEAVASSGTALTSEHLRLIKRFTDNIIFAFDADSAGVAAARRAALLALPLGMDVSIAPLPSGSDPADLVKKDPKAWARALEGKIPIVSFLLKIFKEKGDDARTFRKNVSKEVVPLVAYSSGKIEQEHFIQEIADALSVHEDAVRKEVELAISEKERGAQNISEAPAAQSTVKKTMSEVIKEKLIGVILWQETAAPPAIDLPHVKKTFEDVTGEKYDAMLRSLSSSAKENAILQAELSYTDLARLPAETKELLVNLEKELLEIKLEKILMELKQAEKDKDAEKGMILLQKCQDISKRIHEIKNSRFA